MFDINFIKLEEGIAHSEVVVDKAWTNPFGIAHGGFLFSILAISLITATFRRNATAPSLSQWNGIIEGLSYVNGNKGLKLLLLLTFINNIFII